MDATPIRANDRDDLSVFTAHLHKGLSASFIRGTTSAVTEL
jgi:hypothetical protein